MREGDRCHVANAECHGCASGDCFRCGLAVCNPCSKVQKYLRYGRKRICDDCREEMKREEVRRGRAD